MLAVFLIGIYSILLLTVYGAGFFASAEKIIRVEKADPPTLLQTALAGFIPLVWLTSLISIFSPVNENVAILLLLGAIGLSVWLWFHRRNWLIRWLNGFHGLHPLTWVTIGTSLITTLVLATLKPGNSDTGLYHAQAIRWIETFPAVPGLGNLHSRLAFNSNWFPLQAGFSFAFLDLRSFHLMGAVLTGLCLVYFGGGLQQLLRSKICLSNWMRLSFLPLTFYVLASEISSTGTDLPVTLLTWVILCMWVETFEKPADGMDWRHLLLFSLPVIAGFHQALGFSAAGGHCLGCAFQPAQGERCSHSLGHHHLYTAAVAAVADAQCDPFRLFNLSANVARYFQCPLEDAPERVQDETDWIISWARFPRLDKEIVLAMPVTQWAAMWFDDLSKNRQIILLVLAAAPFSFGLARLAAFAFFHKRARDWFQPFAITWPVWLVTYAGILFWFFSVPRYRFGNGVLMAGLVLVILCGFGLFRSIIKPLTRLAPGFLAALISLYVVFVLVSSADAKTLPSRLWLPANYVNLPTAPCGFGDFGTACATQYQQCGYNPFPCAPQGIPNVYMRGKSFGDGFEVR